MNKQQRNSRRQEMFSLVEKWQNGSQDQIRFCEEEGISYSTFQYWLKSYRRQQKKSSGFIPMEVISGRNHLVEIRYPNGVSIQLPVFDLKILKHLVNL